MIDGTTVSENEHGLIRVFKGSYELSMELGHVGTYDRLCRALGISRIGDKDVQRFEVHTLGGMALSQFLMDAYEVSADDIAPHATALNATEGMILVIRSGAFLDRPATLSLNDDVNLIATLREPGTASSILPSIMTKSADGILTSPPAKKKPSDAAMGGRVATIALIVMALLVWVMIKIAG